MVGSSHEGLRRICQKDPAGFTRTLQRVLHIPIPEPREFAVLNADLTEIEPIERRVDTLLRAETDVGTYLLVVESQGEQDKEKRSSWAYYLSYLDAVSCVVSNVPFGRLLPVPSAPRHVISHVAEAINRPR